MLGCPYLNWRTPLFSVLHPDIGMLSVADLPMEYPQDIPTIPPYVHNSWDVPIT